MKMVILCNHRWLDDETLEPRGSSGMGTGNGGRPATGQVHRIQSGPNLMGSRKILERKRGEEWHLKLNNILVRNESGQRSVN